MYAIVLCGWHGVLTRMGGLDGFDNAAKGQVDAGVMDTRRFWQAVVPLGLGGTAHDQQAARIQHQGDGLFGLFVAKAKFSYRAKA